MAKRVDGYLRDRFDQLIAVREMCAEFAIPAWTLHHYHLARRSLQAGATSWCELRHRAEVAAIVLSSSEPCCRATGPGDDTNGRASFVLPGSWLALSNSRTVRRSPSRATVVECEAEWRWSLVSR